MFPRAERISTAFGASAGSVSVFISSINLLKPAIPVANLLKPAIPVANCSTNPFKRLIGPTKLATNKLAATKSGSVIFPCMIKYPPTAIVRSERRLLQNSMFEKKLAI